MFWRRKTDGFEWHKYVRTTIKLRRDDRRRRIHAAKDAAIEGIENAGRASLAAGRSGAETLGAAIIAGAKAMFAVVIAGAKRAYAIVRDAIVAAAAATWRAGAALGQAMSRTTAAIWAFLQRRIPVLVHVPTRAAAALALTIAALAAVGLGVLAARNLPASGLNPIALIPGLGPTIVEGRAVAVTGDTLRIDGKLVKLVGIEAPELDQRCGPSRAASRCGVRAQSELRDLVRGKAVRCETSGADAGGRILGTCQASGRDLAADLVGKGHAFADEGVLYSRYGAREREAREAKLGIWRSGNAERPKVYRDRRWELAQKSAPQGCPIKGHVVGNDRVYVLPWSPQYERVRVREQRGGRWFCSEEEARSAGWRRVERS